MDLRAHFNVTETKKLKNSLYIYIGNLFSSWKCMYTYDHYPLSIQDQIFPQILTGYLIPQISSLNEFTNKIIIRKYLVRIFIYRCNKFKVTSSLSKNTITFSGVKRLIAMKFHFELPNFDGGFSWCLGCHLYVKNKQNRATSELRRRIRQFRLI